MNLLLTNRICEKKKSLREPTRHPFNIYLLYYVKCRSYQGKITRVNFVRLKDHGNYSNVSVCYSKDLNVVLPIFDAIALYFLRNPRFEYLYETIEF